MHHPPIPVPLLRAAELIELADQHLLADVVRGTDVRLVLGGHFHYTRLVDLRRRAGLGGLGQLLHPDPAPVDRFVSGVDGHQAFTMLHLYDDQVVHTLVPLAPVPEVSGYPSDVVAQVEALTPEERREILSRKDSEFNSQW